MRILVTAVVLAVVVASCGSDERIVEFERRTAQLEAELAAVRIQAAQYRPLSEQLAAVTEHLHRAGISEFQHRWWCLDTPGGQGAGACFRSADHCERSLAAVKKGGADPGAQCRGKRVAYCRDATNTTCVGSLTTCEPLGDVSLELVGGLRRPCLGIE